MRYDDRPGGAWRATVPPELQGTPAGERYERFLDDAFTAYGRMYEPMEAWFRDRYPKQPHDSDFVYRQTIMAKTCDTLRVLLPAGTRSNLGIYATGQSYEQLLMRLAVHPLAEMREYGELMKAELRKVIPEFLKRVDVEERGVAWSRYWQRNRERTQELTDRVLSEAGAKPEHRDEVTLVDYDPEGETKVAAAVLYASSAMPDDQLLALVRSMPRERVAEILRTSVGDRSNRRHKPGRAWERTGYRFDVLCDYGAFRDLQRHRPLTIEWQRLTTEHGYETPSQIDEAGLRSDWERVMQASAETERALLDAGFVEQAQYAVSMAYRIRFVMQMTAREAMHLTELRSQPAGHPVYRRVAQRMHQLIADVHPAIGEMFGYVSYDEVDLERLEAERRTERKRAAMREGSPGA
jgi:thymidylate synthase ThyX